MVREDPDPPNIIYKSRVCVNPGKASQQSMMLQDFLNEKLVCITNYSQVTSVTKPHCIVE